MVINQMQNVTMLFSVIKIKHFYPHEIGQVDTVLKGKKDKLNDYDQKCHVQAPGIGLNK